MKHINLYQAAFHPPRVIMPARRLLAGGAVFLCALLALYAWDAWRFTQLEREVSQVTARAADLVARAGSTDVERQADPHVLAEIDRVETRLRNLQLAQDALKSGELGSEAGYSAQFRALSRAREPGAWLTHIEVAGRGQEMTLRGRALTGEDSARLIAGLRREPLFVGLSFAALTLAPPKDSDKPVPNGLAGAVAADPAPPRFLEFTLDARLSERKGEPSASLSPASVNLPELLAKQAAHAGTTP